MTRSSDVRYRRSSDNGALRHVLQEVWRSRCYWCKRLKDYLDLEIDHIIPRETKPDQLRLMIEHIGLRDDFDVDAVDNLAPICGVCNGEKSDLDLTHVPLVVTQLAKAHALAPEVSRRWTRLHESARLGGALVTAANADLADPTVRAVFEENAPAIARRLAEIDPKLIDVVQPRVLMVEFEDRDLAIFVDVALPQSGSTITGILEGVSDQDLGASLIRPLGDLLDRVAVVMMAAMADLDDGVGTPDVGEPATAVHYVMLERVALSASSGDLTFTFDGHFEVSGSASVARSTADGSELEEVQGDALVIGAFAFDLVWSDGALGFDRVWLDVDPTQTDAWVT